MKTSSWNGATGNWGDSANWSNGVPKGLASDAQFTAPGIYTATIGQTAKVKVGSIELNAAGATLAVNGSLTVGRTFDLASGVLSLTGPGAIHGGTLMMDGGTINSFFGTLDGVHVVGTLDLAENGAWLSLTNGSTVAAAGGGAGAINITGANGVLEFVGSQTFDNATINLGSVASGFSGDTVLNTGTLNLGAHSTILVSATRSSGTVGGDTIVNSGLIEAATQFGDLTLNGNSFVNMGSIVDNNGVLFISSRAFVNAATGTITIAAGQVTAVTGGFVNHGALTIDAGGALTLQGKFSLADLGTIDNQGGSQGGLRIEGTLLNRGQTLTLGTGVLSGQTLITGTIQGGTVIPGSGAAELQQPTLDGVTFQGLLGLDTSNAAVTAVNGLVVTGANGLGPGTVVIDGGGAGLFFSGSQTFDNATVRLGGSLGSDSLTVVSSGRNNPATLTLGANLRVVSDGAAAKAAINGTFSLAATRTVINDGTIKAASAGGSFQISPEIFVNNGTVAVSNGDTLSVGVRNSFTNAGTLTVGTGSTAAFGSFGSTFTNTGAITVARSATLDAGGDYTLAALGNIANAGTFIVDGIFDLGGTTVDLRSGPIFGGQATVLKAFSLVQNGTIILGAQHLVFALGELANVTVQGTVDLSAAGAGLRIGSGVTLTGAGGVSPGAIGLTGAGAELDFYDSPTIDNVRITVGNATTADTIGMFSFSNRTQTATLGTGVTILSNADGALVKIAEAFFSQSVIVNNGLIDAAAKGGAFAITVGKFTNNGQIKVENADALTIQSPLSGTGQITIATSGVAELGVVSASQTVAFADATGTLKLTSAAAFAATLAGTTVNDSIDLVNTAATAAVVNAKDRLVITNNGAAVASIQLAGDYSHTTFVVASDGAGGSLITLTTGVTVQGLVQAMAGFGAGRASDSIPLFGAHADGGRTLTLAHPLA